MSQEIQRADPRQRRRVLFALTGVALAAALGILYLDAYLKELHELAEQAQPVAAARAMRAVRTGFALLMEGAVGLSAYLGRTSWRTLRSERFPPPGQRVISDTRIRRGHQARRHGRAGLVLAALTLLLTLAVSIAGHRLFEQLLDSSLKPTPFYLE